jgi:hypothetical protein
MDYPGFRKWKACPNSIELRPADPAFVAATVKPKPPGLLDVLIYDLKGFVVASDSKILVVPPQLRTQRPILLLDRLMAIYATPLPQRLHKSRQALAGCLLLYHPVASTGF